MKRVKLCVALLALSATVLSTGCKKDNNNNSSSNSFNWTGTAPLSVKINGVQYQATSGSATTFLNNGIIVTGQNASDTAISITFSTAVTANTVYSVPSPSNIALTIQTATTAQNGVYESLSGGGVKILSYSTSSVEGLFYGTLTDPTKVSNATYALTDGYFNVSF